MNIRIDNLDFTYAAGGFRLRLPSMRIASGEAAAIVGPSGAGKSTLLRLIGGIHPLNHGEIRLGDRPLHLLGDADRRTLRIRSIGFVFQDFRLVDYLNVRANIRLPFRLSRHLEWSAAAATHLERLAESTGIADKLEDPVSQLSQGEMQRVAICRALIHRPGLILADEPTGNLDFDNKARILRLLLDTARQESATLLLVTHDRENLASFNRIIPLQPTPAGSVPEAQNTCPGPTGR